MVYIIAGLLTFPVTTVLTIAGVGAAFILIPLFTALGIELHQAMAVALLLNSLAMMFASYRYARNKLILWKISIPIIITSSISASIGAMASYRVNQEIISWLFVCFLLFAAGMIIFYNSNNRKTSGLGELNLRNWIISSIVGIFAGFIGGLIGVGGGNIILPVLIALGIKPKEAVGTTALIVIFSSLSGFIGHFGPGELDPVFIGVTSVASILGAVLGAWLMTDKLKPELIKKILGVILVALAIKMIINLL